MVGTTLTTERVGPGRKGRPNYPLEYKRQVALAACEPNTSVAKLAQAHGLNPNMVFKWRRHYRAGTLNDSPGNKAALIPVALDPEAATAEPTKALVPPQALPASTVEIEFNGARLRITGMVDPIQLRLILRCLMPA